MTLSFFSQFASPYLLGIPLIAISILMPWLITPTHSSHFIKSRWGALQNWLVVRFVSQMFSPLNTPGHKWALIFSSLIIFIIMINILGLLPYTFTPTTQLSVSIALAIPLWLSTVLIGFRHQPSSALAHLLPEGTPPLLIPILIIIETISLFIRPLALGVRLTANLTAGHLLIQLIATAAFVLLSILPAVALLTTIILVLLSILEVAVAIIQAYVFVLLITLYLQENV